MIGSIAAMQSNSVIIVWRVVFKTVVDEYLLSFERCVLQLGGDMYHVQREYIVYAIVKYIDIINNIWQETCNENLSLDILNAEIFVNTTFVTNS